jgi:hypothetical protein
MRTFSPLAIPATQPSVKPMATSMWATISHSVYQFPCSWVARAFGLFPRDMGGERLDWEIDYVYVQGAQEWESAQEHIQLWGIQFWPQSSHTLNLPSFRTKLMLSAWKYHLKIAGGLWKIDMAETRHTPNSKISQFSIQVPYIFCSC